ncbi:hypothetical protein FIBSPDRAFT_744692 [Athelia psychrophila]|uniref:Uncharacterized protein n=1 Tax=Athelia psychrophila TaxID=1759441 RepID=A0A166HIU0_9AGAM|nr:hypothetical protein FIBSPDRAFT_744692 [Fibularhizoctonia sp. CBS 109695]
MLPLGQNSLSGDAVPEDSSGWDRGENGRSRNSDQHYRRDQNGGREHGSGGGRDNAPGNGGFGGQGYGGGSGGGRDRDGGGRRQRPADINVSNSTTDESDEEDPETSTDDLAVRRPVKHAIKPVPISPATGTDDDVPLAQQIPTALKAQKTIRRQVRDERDQRRKDRAESSTARKREHTAPLEAPAPTQSFTARIMSRVRTKTLPSSTPRPFAAADLTKKLLGVQATNSAAPQPRSSHGRDPALPQQSLARNPTSARPSGSGPAQPRSARPSTADSDTGERTLRPMRSLHGLSLAAAPTPQETSTRGLSRTNTSSRRHEDGYLSSAPPTSYHLDGSANLERSKSRRQSDEASRSARPSVEHSGQRSPRPPMPPLPAADVLSNMALQPAPKLAVTQQRIFIGDKQRYNSVETTASTTAGEVVQMIESQADLEKLKGGEGGWMLWEVAQDFGMERPLRDFELLADVEASWVKDKSVNIFVVKKSPISRVLARSNIPLSSPRTSGYIDWESKKGKWNKRYMELREHSLWLSKKDVRFGKEENFLCALSNFDVYYVGKHKSPKPFVFAVKSTENISLFESAADYVHYFCCGQSDGETWMQAILLARSYVLYQERNVLFTGANISTSAASKPLSRAGTRKDRSIQPLVTVAASFAAAQGPQPAVFEPGSLLAKQI